MYRKTDNEMHDVLYMSTNERKNKCVIHYLGERHICGEY